MQALWDELLPSVASKSNDDLFKDSDANGDGEIDLEDLKLILERPNEVDRWIATIPIGPLVGSAFSPIINRDKSNADPLRSISTCTDQDLNCIFKGLASGFHQLMRTAIDELKCAHAKQDEMKPQQPESMELRALSCGGVSAFYGGLGDRVGEQSDCEPIRSDTTVTRSRRRSQPEISRGHARRAQEHGALHDGQLPRHDEPRGGVGHGHAQPRGRAPGQGAGQPVHPQPAAAPQRRGRSPAGARPQRRPHDAAAGGGDHRHRPLHRPHGMVQSPPPPCVKGALRPAPRPSAVSGLLCRPCLPGAPAACARVRSRSLRWVGPRAAADVGGGAGREGYSDPRGVYADTGARRLAGTRDAGTFHGAYSDTRRSLDRAARRMLGGSSRCTTRRCGGSRRKSTGRCCGGGTSMRPRFTALCPA